MIVAFDGRPFLGRATGICRYNYCLLQAMRARYPGIFFKCFATSLKGGQHSVFMDLPAENRYRSFIPNRLLNLLWGYTGLLPVERFVGSCDIVHASNYFYIPHRAGSRYITTVYDLHFLKFSFNLSRDVRHMLRKRLGAYLARSQRVITISQAVKQEITERFGLPAKHIKVIYPGVTLPPGSPSPPPGARAGGLILSVGQYTERKNYPLLMSAFLRVKQNLPDARLLIAGPVPAKHKKAVAAWQAKGIIFTGYLDDTALWRLYRRADLFVLPSVDEGFGMPVVEAQLAGVPTLLSDIPVFREISGAASLYCPTGDSAAMARTIIRLLRDQSLRRQLIARGRKNAGRYTWAAAADRTVAVYREVME